MIKSQLKMIDALSTKSQLRLISFCCLTKLFLKELFSICSVPNPFWSDIKLISFEAIPLKKFNDNDLPLKLSFSISGLPCQLIPIVGLLLIRRIFLHLLILVSGGFK